MPDLTDEDVQFIRDLREKHEDGKVNRRQALGMLGAAGVGAAGGFLGTGSAAADPSTSDSDGNVGLPSDPVDVFAEGIKAESLSGVVIAEPGDNLQTKLNDAAGGGLIIMPGDYNDTGIVLPSNTTVWDFGTHVATANGQTFIDLEGQGTIEYVNWYGGVFDSAGFTSVVAVKTGQIQRSHIIGVTLFGTSGNPMSTGFKIGDAAGNLTTGSLQVDNFDMVNVTHGFDHQDGYWIDAEGRHGTGSATVYRGSGPVTGMNGATYKIHSQSVQPFQFDSGTTSKNFSIQASAFDITSNGFVGSVKNAEISIEAGSTDRVDISPASGETIEKCLIQIKANADGTEIGILQGSGTLKNCRIEAIGGDGTNPAMRPEFGGMTITNNVFVVVTDPSAPAVIGTPDAGYTVQDNSIVNQAGVAHCETDTIATENDGLREKRINLSGQTGRYDGQEKKDNGSNTAGNGIPCVWDATGTAWQPVDGSATFS